MGQLNLDRPLFFPDIEGIVVAFLGARPELDGTIVDVVPPPNFDGSQRAVVVSRLGGAYLSDDGLDDTVTKFDTYGPRKSVAMAVAGAVRGVLPLLPQATHANGTVVADVDEIQGPCWSPDRKRLDANRYVMRYRLVVGVSPVPA